MAEQPQTPDYGIDRYELASSAVQVTTEEDYKRAGEVLVRVASVIKKLLEGDTDSNWVGWNEIVAASKVNYDKMRKARENHVSRWNIVKTAYQNAMSKYQQDQELKTERFQTAMQTAADKIRKKIENDAKQLMRAGKAEQANQLLAQLEMMPLKPEPAPLDFRLPGVSHVDDYEIEITDLKALVEAVAAGKVPLKGTVQKKEFPLFDVRLSVVEGYVRSLGANFDWPGVKVTKKKLHRARAV